MRKPIQYLWQHASFQLGRLQDLNISLCRDHMVLRFIYHASYPLSTTAVILLQFPNPPSSSLSFPFPHPSKPPLLPIPNNNIIPTHQSSSSPSSQPQQTSIALHCCCLLLDGWILEIGFHNLRFLELGGVQGGRRRLEVTVYGRLVSMVGLSCRVC